jgi:peptide/nickel transport system substrate-binding protein/oligopeptide transport system substrate-binding protein
MRLGTRKLSIAGLVVIIGTLAMLLSACGSTSSGNGQQASKDKQIFKPLTSGANAGDIDSFDPGQIQFGFDYDKAQMIYPALITLTDDLKPLDWAAKSHEVSSDGLTYTFHLNSGMKWSDGTAIDANTFAFAINRSLDPCFASGVSYYNLNIKGATDYSGKTCDAATTTDEFNGLDKTAKTALIGKSIVVSDPLTLAVTIEAPAAYFLSEMSYPTFWGVPQQLIAKYGQTKWTDHMADGSGLGGNLYKLTKWDKAGHLEFTANDSFWGKPAIIQHVNYTLYKDVNTEWADYKSGVGDSSNFPSTEVATAKALKGSQYQQVTALSISWLQMSQALAPFDDVRVRNAFSLAIDRKAIATNVAKGLANPTIHMVIKGLPGYNPDLKNAAGDSGDKTTVANVAKASELAKAYAADKCSGDFSKCTPIIYTYANGSSTQLLLAQVLQQEWQTAFPGWNITLQGMDRSVQLKSYQRLQIAWGGWGADYPDPQDFLTLLWSKDAQYNQSYVNVPAADALMTAADINSDQTARLKQYQQAEQLLIDNGAFIAYSQPLNTQVVRDHIVGWHQDSSLEIALPTWQTAYVKA